MEIKVDLRLYDKHSVGTITRIKVMILNSHSVEKKMLGRKARKSWIETIQWNGVKYVVTCKIEEEDILALIHIRQSSSKQKYKMKKNNRRKKYK